MNSNTKSSNTKMMKAKNQMRHLAANLLAALTLGLPLLAHAAIVPDRTRVIYNEGEPSVSVTISNKNPKLPFIAQSWIEDEKSVKITSPFMVLPPIQRVEPNDSNVLRVVKLPGDTLPKDRESVFYLNIREIPPKAMQSTRCRLRCNPSSNCSIAPRVCKPSAAKTSV
ncbi:gram-negative pili assembly chaperone, N-terminal domain protein [Collimonas arenae]|nr:gram-negative pili assembly chaperone, N-terminal domain protein [Collimonas arenae]